ncbi:hypothetical protein ABH940_004031 [Streptacidiphilus sp. BW17]|uniref:DUF6817 domain-containing protein n=1 Tax=Streptacidiphilus sp. BW17 TaxID=3156274 RepID=UPI00351214D5
MRQERERALTLLRQAGAETIDHPGGTLLAHLGRVDALLTSWGARPDLALAGLCHAFYGTDEFPVALLPLDRRAELVAAIGTGAEELVHFYASCDRKASYHGLTDGTAPFVDRFTGRATFPDLSARRDFAELTAANELDVLAASADMRTRHGASLRSLLTRWVPLLSPAARAHCATVLGVNE